MTNNPLKALPEGLGMALAQNIYAMEHFAAMSEPERQTVISRARSVQSAAEMQSLVNSLIKAIPHNSKCDIAQQDFSSDDAKSRANT